MEIVVLRITEKARKRIGDLLKEEPTGSFLRLKIEGGGCAGFQYQFDVDSVKAEEDLEFLEGQFIVDQCSALLVESAEVDFVEDLMGASFRVKNPNATSSCGCGTSFSIDE